MGESESLTVSDGEPMPASAVGAPGAMPDAAHQDSLAGDVPATDNAAGEQLDWGSIHEEDGAAAEGLAQGQLMAKRGERCRSCPDASHLKIGL